jgi:hypothetical protein
MVGHPACDGGYLALAESMSCAFATGDAWRALPAGPDFRVLALTTIDLS